MVYTPMKYLSPSFINHEKYNINIYEFLHCFVGYFLNRQKLVGNLLQKRKANLFHENPSSKGLRSTVGRYRESKVCAVTCTLSHGTLSILWLCKYRYNTYF